MVIDLLRIPLSVDALFGDSQYKELSNWIRYHRPADCAAECDGLEDSQCPRTIDNASHLAPGLPGKADDKLPDQVSTVGAWRGSPSKCHLDFFKELLPLWLRKTNNQPGEARQ